MSIPAPPPVPPVRVLVVDDEPAMRRAMTRTLIGHGFKVEAQESGEAALGLLAGLSFDVMLVDVVMPGMNGLELLQEVKSRHPGVEVVMLTGSGDIGTAVEALRLGAYHFLTKAAEAAEVCRVIENAADHKRLLDLTRALEQRLEKNEAFGGLVGSSRPMADVYRLAQSVAMMSTTVLITGENGTGKELIARAIHRSSARSQRPFVAVNCGAIPETLVEAELFGSVRGAFSDAKDKPGFFEQADGGTIFLDEIGELPLSAQVKLLRVLQEGEVRRLGATSDKAIDVRVIAATNVGLRARMADGRFREDLFFRLNIFPIELPPLRMRKDDIPALAYHFLKKHGDRMGRDVKHIGTEAMRLLREHAWPGNVRELENAIERAIVLARSDTIVPGDLPSHAPKSARPDAPAERVLPEGLDELTYARAKERAMDLFDRHYVEGLLKRHGDNMTRAAAAAGMDRSNFRRLVKRVRGKADDESDEDG